MYEQVSHGTLNQILDELRPEIRREELRFFYSRLGANFYAIYNLFERLYGNREDFYDCIKSLVEIMAKNYIARPLDYKKKDRRREKNSGWFLDQQWVGMALYANGFSRDLRDLQGKLNYFSELGVNLVHVLPILSCPQGKSDGGYAVSDFRKVDERLGSNEDLQNIIDGLHVRDSLIALDVVVNHCSEQHEWAKRAIMGEQKYQDYFYMFESREIPDLFEQSMLEVFPETDPGNFSWNDDIEKWVMTVFHHYQWDLNYTNPEVFIEMLDIILFWANKGVDILRLDAVAFLWKKIGSVSQNEEEAHLLLQLFKDCCQVVAPGMIFIAEAIVAPIEIIKYFGEDAVVAKECDIAYNATLMALLWDGVATKNAKLLNRGLKNLPGKLDGATWLNYLRCHDDIGFGFEDRDIAASGYNPQLHRRFLIEYFSGGFPSSPATGEMFGYNDKTGDARISGSLASLVGLESAIRENEPAKILRSIDHILMLHSVIMCFGGIPLLYYGDEVGTLNDYAFRDDPDKSHDSRWLHRPRIDWLKNAKRAEHSTVESKIFSGLQHLIKIRKSFPVLADANNREIVDISNEDIFAFTRFDPYRTADSITVVANFSDQRCDVALSEIMAGGYVNSDQIYDLWADSFPFRTSDTLKLDAFEFSLLVLESPSVDP